MSVLEESHNILSSILTILLTCLNSDTLLRYNCIVTTILTVSIRTFVCTLLVVDTIACSTIKVIGTETREEL